MSERVTPDFSIMVRFGEEEVLINRMYDNVHIFDWLGHGILKVVATEGFLQWHTTQDMALEVAERAQIDPLYRTSISEHEYEQYLKTQEQFLGDDWLDGGLT